MALDIRDAAAADEAAWRQLWTGYLAFYKADVPEEVTAYTWSRILDPASRVSMRVALEDGRMLGFAIHHHHDSTWDISPEGYLEDLFVDETARGGGVGRALVDDLVAISRKNGWRGIYWHTNRENARARRLYDSYIPSDGYVRYRLRT